MASRFLERLANCAAEESARFAIMLCEETGETLYDALTGEGHFYLKGLARLITAGSLSSVRDTIQAKLEDALAAGGDQRKICVVMIPLSFFSGIRWKVERG
mgnify:FL=1